MVPPRPLSRPDGPDLPKHEALWVTAAYQARPPRAFEPLGSPWHASRGVLVTPDNHVAGCSMVPFYARKVPILTRIFDLNIRNARSRHVNLTCKTVAETSQNRGFFGCFLNRYNGLCETHP